MVNIIHGNRRVFPLCWGDFELARKPSRATEEARLTKQTKEREAKKKRITAERAAEKPPLAKVAQDSAAAKHEKAMYDAIVSEANTDLADLQDFLTENPDTPGLMKIVKNVAAVKVALAEKKGSSVKTALTDLRATLAKEKGFSAFMASREKERKKQQAVRVNSVKKDLKSYTVFLKRQIAKNIISNLALAQVFVPVVEALEGGLSSNDLAVLQALKAKTSAAMKKHGLDGQYAGGKEPTEEARAVQPEKAAVKETAAAEKTPNKKAAAEKTPNKKGKGFFDQMKKDLRNAAQELKKIQKRGLQIETKKGVRSSVVAGQKSTLQPRDVAEARQCDRVRGSRFFMKGEAVYSNLHLYMDEGMKAFKRNDFVTARCWLEATAKHPNRHPRSKYSATSRLKTTYWHLGWIYETGQGAKQNMKIALGWYKQGAKLGDSNSQHALGRMYFGGKGVTKNVKTALKWFTLAAKQGLERSKKALQDPELKKALSANKIHKGGSLEELDQFYWHYQLVALCSQSGIVSKSRLKSLEKGINSSANTLFKIHKIPKKNQDKVKDASWDSSVARFNADQTIQMLRMTGLGTSGLDLNLRGKFSPMCNQGIRGITMMTQTYKIMSQKLSGKKGKKKRKF